MLLVNLLTWFIIARTTDVRLFKNSPALPLPLLGDAVPLVGFYLGVPLLLFAFYISFHFFLLRLWGGLGITGGLSRRKHLGQEWPLVRDGAGAQSLQVAEGDSLAVVFRGDGNFHPPG